MASNIELIIFDGGSPSADLPGSAAVVPLLHGLCAIPVSNELLASLPAGTDDDRVRAGWILKQQVCSRAQDLSARRRVLYVAGQTFGGRGCQEAAGWKDSQLIYGPSGTCDGESDRADGYRVVHRADSAINVGLRIMGVRAADGLDEYGSAGLDRHRFTSDWLGR